MDILVIAVAAIAILVLYGYLLVSPWREKATADASLIEFLTEESEEYLEKIFLYRCLTEKLVNQMCIPHSRTPNLIPLGEEYPEWKFCLTCKEFVKNGEVCWCKRGKV